MKLTWSDISRDKQQHRDGAAARPIAEKLRVLERLRERDAEIKRAAAPSDAQKRDGEISARG